MAYENDEFLSILSNQIRQGNLIVFLGAGLSRTYTDTTTGKTYYGIPAAREIIENISKEKVYISQDMSFEQAFFMIKNREGRTEVERVLEDYVDIPTLKPLPAHELLAEMSFPAFITTNFDGLLEKALDKNRKKYYSIIEDKDVCRWRNYQVPYIKLHGCVTRPSSMIAAEDEYIPFSLNKPIITSLIKTLLANKVVLFLGFSLGDSDFKNLYKEINIVLGKNMPQSYAVVYEYDDYQKTFWKEEGITLLKSDLTSFLRDLFKETIIDKRKDTYHPSEDWMNNIFFENLHEIRNSPSETQAIDAFLHHLLREIQSPVLSCEDIYIRATNAVEMILKSKPNFQAFYKLWQLLGIKLENILEDQRDTAESMIEELIEERRGVSRTLSKKWKQVVKKGNNILVYSQSIQMLELLKGVSKTVQESCKLFVCECRPKSPTPFQDAIAICEYLKETNYTVSILPDVSIANLFARHQIDIVLMGAHSLYFRGDKFVSYVNTCGSNMISVLADFYSVPVYIIAESSKIVNLTNEENEVVSYEEEENIFSKTDAINFLHLESTMSINELNIGYDLCKVNERIILITDKEG